MPYFQIHGHHGELEQRPALVSLDYELGGSTGVDFLYWLRVRKKIKSLPVIMFSGSPGRSHIAECYAAGADHYLPNQAERLRAFKENCSQALRWASVPPARADSSAE